MAVSLNGTTDYWRGTKQIAAPSKTLSFVMVFKTGSAVTGATRTLFAIMNAGESLTSFSVAITSSAGLTVIGRDTGDVFRLILTSSGLTLSASTWYVLHVAADVEADDGFIYVNDVSYGTEVTILDVAVDLSREVWVGASNDGSNDPTNFFDGVISYVFLSTTYADPSVEANRRAFYGERGEQIGLGAGGEAALGVAPELLLNSGPGNFGRNVGTGADLAGFGSPAYTAGRPASVETLARGFVGEEWRESQRSGIPFSESDLVLESASGLEVGRREWSTDRDEINRRRRRNAVVFRE